MKIPLIQIDDKRVEIRTRVSDMGDKEWSAWIPFEFDARYPSLGAMLLLSITLKTDLAIVNQKQSDVTISARCATADGETIRTVEYQARLVAK